ncbi:MAG: hypothetical protein ACHQAX_08560, partial [Gammaproteobacteria bacterium]
GSFISYKIAIIQAARITAEGWHMRGEVFIEPRHICSSEPLLLGRTTIGNIEGILHKPAWEIVE